MTLNQRFHYVLWLIAAGSATKIAVILIQKTYLNPRTWEYEILANNLLQGVGYQIEHLQTLHYSLGPPLYTFICAGIYWLIGHSFLVLLLLQVGLCALLSYAVLRIGEGLFGVRCGIIACGLVSFHPGLAFYAVRQIHPLLLDATFIALVCWSALRALNDPLRSRLILLGLVAGICILTRPTITFFLPLVVGLILYQHRSRWSQLLPGALVSLALAALVVLPWTLRNWRIHDEFVYITTDTGELLWRGNHQGATGYGLSPDGQPSFDAMPEDFKQKVWALDELGQKQFMQAQALEFIRQHPGEFIHNTWRKITYFWWFYPLAGVFYPEVYLKVYHFIYAVVLVLALVGISAGWLYYPQARGGIVLFLLLFAVVCFSQSLFYVNIRHRWGIEALLILFSSLGLTFMWQKTGLGSDDRIDSN